MNNELLLVISLIFTYSIVLLGFYLFGEKVLYCFTVFATIVANIEVLILVEAFGMEQTLGNILFASTFLVTDILSEIYGKEKSKTAVNIGIFISIIFIIISQSWFFYEPSVNDTIFENIKQVFSNTPRMMLVSILVYSICQRLDVWIYHKIWKLTSRNNNVKSGLWIRNNFSTLISQFINSILFTFGAFWGIYDFKTIFSITFISYFIFIITSLLDTPFIYLARYIHENKKIKV